MNTCAHAGCTNPVTSRDPRALYCSNAHKSAAWRARTGYRLTGTQTAGQTRKRRGGPSGPQLSYHKTQRELEWRLWEFPEVMAIVDEVLLDVMPAKQRERLEARYV